MTESPLISVCIANYNGMSCIDDCIQSVLQQNDAPTYEIIVHDDASTDESTTHLKKVYPDIHLIESNDNVGFCIANNRMAAIARGEYLLLLNNDAALFPDALSTLYRAALEIGKPAILGLPQYDFDNGRLIDIGNLLDPFLNPVPNTDPLRTDVGMVIGACMWIPKTLWNELGGFPDWFGSIGEDLYLCCVSRLIGYQVKALGVSGYRHKVGMSFGGGKIQNKRLLTAQRRRSLSERNKSYVMFISYPAPALYLIMPLHLLFLILEGVILSIAKLNARLLHRIYLQAVIALWKQRSELLTMRRKYQGLRNCSLARWFRVFRPSPYKLRMLIKHGLPIIR
jgi:GT2 family glycosyltransferase